MTFCVWKEMVINKHEKQDSLVPSPFKGEGQGEGGVVNMEGV